MDAWSSVTSRSPKSTRDVYAFGNAEPVASGTPEVTTTGKVVNLLWPLAVALAVIRTAPADTGLTEPAASTVATAGLEEVYCTLSARSERSQNVMSCLVTDSWALIRLSGASRLNSVASGWAETTSTPAVRCPVTRRVTAFRSASAELGPARMVQSPVGNTFLCFMSSQNHRSPAPMVTLTVLEVPAIRPLLTKPFSCLRGRWFPSAPFGALA